MIGQPFKEIIEKLAYATQQKKVKWERTERDTEFKVVLGSSMVTTDNWTLESGDKCVDLGLWNSDGDVVARIAFENNQKEEEDYKTLVEFYNQVKNSYYKIDDTVLDILSHLEFKE